MPATLKDFEGVRRPTMLPETEEAGGYQESEFNDEG